MDSQHDYGANTLLAHWGEEEKLKGAVVQPIFQNSLFTFASIDELYGAMVKNPAGPPYHYSRVGNPTVEIAEKKIAKLEGTEACKLLGSGMAAISVAILSCVQAGSHVILLDTCYGPTRVFIKDYLAKFGVTYTEVDGRDTQEILDAIRPETSLIMLESPSSLLFRLQDVAAVTAVARGKGIATVIDNTYCTPLYCQPAKLGVDIVCHSVTKYLGGHSDITAGAVCCSQERMDRMIRAEVALIGSMLHPFSAWLLTRGLRTLKVRLKQHEATANEVAAWLEARPEVAQVHHVGLPSYPQRELFRRQMTGSSGLFSFETVQQDPERIKAFCDALQIFQRGISWGGFESLVVALPVHPLDYAQQRWIVRLSIGLEEPEDLIRDLEAAMGLLATA